MHIVIGFLTAILTLLYVLERLGIDIGWFNPWSWRRRRAWAKRYHGDPIYSVENPIDVAAILIVGTAKLEGDLSAEQKAAILGQFEENFSLDSRAAAELLGSATHLLGAPQVIGTQLDGVASRNKETFDAEQAKSMIEIIEETAAIGGAMSDTQREYVDKLRTMHVARDKKGTWG